VDSCGDQLLQQLQVYQAFFENNKTKASTCSGSSSRNSSPLTSCRKWQPTNARHLSASATTDDDVRPTLLVFRGALSPALIGKLSTDCLDSALSAPGHVSSMSFNPVIESGSHPWQQGAAAVHGLASACGVFSSSQKPSKRPEVMAESTHSQTARQFRTVRRSMNSIRQAMISSGIRHLAAARMRASAARSYDPGCGCCCVTS
jgi:hypothetical protein